MMHPSTFAAGKISTFQPGSVCGFAWPASNAPKRAPALTPKALAAASNAPA